MIKLSDKTINSMGFAETIHNLANQKFSDFQAGYNVARIYRKYQKEANISRQEWLKWAAEYMIKDEKGNFVMETDQKAKTIGVTPFKIVAGKEDEFLKKMEDFLKVEIEIESYPIKETELSGIPLTPQEILNIEPLLAKSTWKPEVVK